jgi:hypothetical protein
MSHFQRPAESSKAYVPTINHRTFPSQLVNELAFTSRSFIPSGPHQLLADRATRRKNIELRHASTFSLDRRDFCIAPMSR